MAGTFGALIIRRTIKSSAMNLLTLENCDMVNFECKGRTLKSSAMDLLGTTVISCAPPGRCVVVLLNSRTLESGTVDLSGSMMGLEIDILQSSRTRKPSAMDLPGPTLFSSIVNIAYLA